MWTRGTDLPNQQIIRRTTDFVPFLNDYTMIISLGRFAISTYLATSRALGETEENAGRPEFFFHIIIKY